MPCLCLPWGRTFNTSFHCLCDNINCKSALVQVMFRRWTCTKPLPWVTMTPQIQYCTFTEELIVSAVLLCFCLLWCIIIGLMLYIHLCSTMLLHWHCASLKFSRFQGKNPEENGCFLPTLQWRHNGCDCVSNCRCLDCSLNRLFR